MLRIHFTSDDLSRIRLTPRADIMWEILLSSYRLRHSAGTVLFGEWRRAVTPRLATDALALTALAPPVGYAVDFLTPVGAGQTLAEGTEALRGTTRTRLRNDLEELSRRHPGRPLPGWTRDLADGSPEALTHLADSVTGYFSTALKPYWRAIQLQVTRDHDWRRNTLDERGWEAVLATLHPSAQWNYPELRLAFPADHDIHLEGRGLILQPSFFCWGPPTTFLDTELTPILVYPVERSVDWYASTQRTRHSALAALLGKTRARVLELVAVGSCTTTQLAGRAGLPVQTASNQVTVLREADLISSRRHRNTVIHTITTLGEALLEGDTPGPRSSSHV
ncbi:ArsR/SmtB family transcription factor [Streptomyces sp. NPDC018610]|uniref:ArsR/SmtB family transcription factor n=1 Tax=Streptomyces sp. NPDC018610 TaxID=3365049 RepID=UPI0037B23EEB